MHGHSYQIDVIVEGELDAELGWLLDFGDLVAKVSPLITTLDHHVLNEIDGLLNPTSELLAVWMWDHLKPVLPQLVELQVAETPSSRCVYRGG
jgi:6-pyruvoyltetrahydropterin/6-carboxytetrahydropterin synthase